MLIVVSIYMFLFFIYSNNISYIYEVYVCTSYLVYVLKIKMFQCPHHNPVIKYKHLQSLQRHQRNCIMAQSTTQIKQSIKNICDAILAEISTEIQDEDMCKTIMDSYVRTNTKNGLFPLIFAEFQSRKGEREAEHLRGMEQLKKDYASGPNLKFRQLRGTLNLHSYEELKTEISILKYHVRLGELKILVEDNTYKAYEKIVHHLNEASLIEFQQSLLSGNPLNFLILLS